MKGVKMVSLGMVILLVLLLIGALGMRGWQSQTPPELGLINGHLRACPDKPNCVCSEAAAEDQAHAIAPLGDPDWHKLKQAIQQAGGVVTNDGGQYLHATFTSTLFRFVDDVEARRDAVQKLIHIRSASRVGHSDFGANRKRVGAIRLRLERLPSRGPAD